MKLFFDADIFKGQKAGIYRYSKEIANRFSADLSREFKFISSSGLGAEVLTPVLEELFGSEVGFHDKYLIVKGGVDVPFERKSRDHFFNLTAQVGIDQSWHYKVRREWARLAYRRESRLFKSGRIKVDLNCEKPVLFGPHKTLFQKFGNMDDVFSVQVVHDLIPVLFPHYFDDRSGFDGVYNSLDKVDLILTVSESTRRDLLRLRPDIHEEKVVAVPIAASEHFKPITDREKISHVKEKYGIPASSEYVFSLSTVEPRKNQIRLIKAWLDVYQRLNGDNPKLVIAGRKGWGSEFQKQLGELEKYCDSIILTGFIEDDDLPYLYAGCKFAAYPTLYEGFGIPVLEAISVGKFCVTSNNSSIPEIVGSEYPLIDPSSVHEIAQLILKAFNDSEFLLEMEKLGLKRSEQFGWEKTYNNTINIVKKRSEIFFEKNKHRTTDVNT